jgi:hypothetical protein
LKVTRRVNEGLGNPTGVRCNFAFLVWNLELCSRESDVTPRYLAAVRIEAEARDSEEFRILIYSVEVEIKAETSSITDVIADADEARRVRPVLKFQD